MPDYQHRWREMSDCPVLVYNTSTELTHSYLNSGITPISHFLLILITQQFLILV